MIEKRLPSLQHKTKEVVALRGPDNALRESMPQVTIVPTGQSFAADPGEPVLAAALRAGLNLPHSCKGGHCASCRARILSGTVAYPGGELPAGISEAEAAENYALLCQAVAVTDLVVETRAIKPAPEVEVRSLPCRIDRMERL